MKYNLFVLYFLADIFDETAPAIEDAGLDCECVGGGRILHDSGKRKIEIYGHSQVSFSYNLQDLLLTLIILDKNFSSQHFIKIFLYSPENGLWHFKQIVAFFWEN